MKSMKRVAALVMAILFVGVGVLSNVGTVSNVEAAAKISTKKKTLNQGQKLTLKVSGAKGTIKWSVNNDNVKLNKKTGKSVKVTAVKAGTSKVTAKAKGKKLTCTIKVNGLNIVKKELTVGQSFKLKATGLGKKIKWSVSNKNVTIKVSKKVNVTATAKAEGTSVITAKVGKKSYKCTVVVKHVHKTVKVPGKAATCVEPGLTDGQKCSACGQIVVAQKEIPVLAHATIHFDAVEPGCHSLGNVEYWYCPDCEGFWTDAACTRVTNSKSVNLPAKGSENLQHVAAVEPTATENGNVEYWYCPDCEGYWLDEACTRLTNRLSVILPATGEEPVEGETEDNPIYVMQEPPLSVEIPAGKVVYYAGYYDGMILTIEDASAYVMIGETKYVPVEGVVTVQLSAPGFRMPVVFGVGNDGTENKAYTVNLDYPTGTRTNPESLTEATGSIELAESNEGYWFGYTAEQTGVLHVTVSGDAGWQYSVENPAEAFYGDYHYSDDEPVVNTELVPVSQGETVYIWVATYDIQASTDMFNYYPNPAGTVSVAVELESATGQIFGPSSSVEVAAGDINYYEGYGIGGMIMTINDTNACVFVGGTKHVAWDGPLTVTLPTSMNPRMPIAVFIQNSGSEAATFDIAFSYAEGHMENPQVVTEDGEYNMDIAAGSQGYFITYTAQSSGTLNVAIASENGWSYTINNLTAGTYGDVKNSVDNANEAEATIEVSAGDEIQIIVNTYNADEPYNAPEGTVGVNISFEESTGLGTGADTDDGYGEIF